MANAFELILCALVGFLRSKAALQAEVLVLRHQLDILRRKSPKRFVLTGVDRLVFIALYCLVPDVMDALAIIRPETVIRWHRSGFRRFWRWKSRRGSGRPKVSVEIRKLIREMSVANPLWGAPRIHGELLKLGIDVGQTSVAKYMPRRRRPPSQGWKTFFDKPCRWNRSDGPVRGTDDLVPTVIRSADFASRSTPDHMVRGDQAPDCGVDCSPTH